MIDPASIDFKGSRQIIADCEPDKEPRVVIALADHRVVSMQKQDGEPRVLFGPVSKREAEDLARAVVAGDARALTDPLALGVLATAFLGFITSGAGPAASSGSDVGGEAPLAGSAAAPSSCSRPQS
jgi:hypothetical protein